jgi:hypothetical protein
MTGEDHFLGQLSLQKLLVDRLIAAPSWQPADASAIPPLR